MPSDGTVHVIDDDMAVRQSLAFLLQTVGIPVRVYDSAVAFLNALPAVQRGCVVTDIRMPEIHGLELQRRLKPLDLSLPIIVITGHGDVPLAVEAMKAGAVDFIEKPFDDEVVLSAVRSALDLHARESERKAQTTETVVRLGSLSERESQVLAGLVAGHPNKVIARELGISPRTVEIYRANVMTKMQASSLSELVRMSLLTGVVPVGSMHVKPNPG